MTCRNPKITALAAALVLTTAALASAGPRACIREAKREAKDCAAACKEGFQTAKDTCLNRDHACVEVCRANRSQCRLDTGIDAAIDWCNDRLEARRAMCRNENPPGDARDACIDRAQVTAFQCRDSARETARPFLKQCRKAFRNCAKACPPAGPADPPVDPKTCIRDANEAAKVCGATCREEYQVAKDDCRNRDHACMENCRADRNTCREPVRALLKADLEECAEARDIGLHGRDEPPPPIDGCDDTYPPPRTPEDEVNFDQCVDGVQVEAFICRDEAHEHARPGFATCKQNFRSCVDNNCPVQP